MKILIADDHALFRDNLALFLSELQPQSVVLQVSSYPLMLKLLKKEQNIDMVVLDLDMKGVEALKTIYDLKSISDNLKIVVISTSEDILQIKKIILSGVDGYILRRTDFSNIKEAFEQIFQDRKYIPEALKDIENENLGKISGKPLTNRQSQVLDLIAQGKSNKQIAYEMGVSEATVKLHINALLRSLKVNNRTQAVITAQKIGLI
ncbi:MAG: response regulator transcription factor [Alphaproteobacteria bacterium]|nr:response regulator transcription factor [Alphaproteobacteria bacterium]